MAKRTETTVEPRPTAPESPTIKVVFRDGDRVRGGRLVELRTIPKLSANIKSDDLVFTVDDGSGPATVRQSEILKIETV